MNLRPTSTTAFGLIAWLEQTQIHLPLKAIECRFAVSGAAVDVQIDQIFHQSAGRPLDVTYSFPLPSQAAAYRCEMIVNGRSIRAKVMEREAAREIARQKKAEGRRTTLVEMERGNLFTLSLGNVQPDDIIVIRFAYVEELDAWKDELALQIPFNPGVRYVPGKPLLRVNSGRGLRLGAIAVKPSWLLLRNLSGDPQIVEAHQTRPGESAHCKCATEFMNDQQPQYDCSILKLAVVCQALPVYYIFD